MTINEKSCLMMKKKMERLGAVSIVPLTESCESAGRKGEIRRTRYAASRFKKMQNREQGESYETLWAQAVSVPDGKYQDSDKGLLCFEFLNKENARLNTSTYTLVPSTLLKMIFLVGKLRHPEKIFVFWYATLLRIALEYTYF